MKRLLALSGIYLSLLVISSSQVFAQLNWTRYPGNPILIPGPPGSFYEGGFTFINVMKNDETYNMWYTASNNQQGQIIGLAQSDDGINFQFCDSVPHFLPSNNLIAFDCKGVFNPQILQINDSLWYMWYSGLDISSFDSQVGLAVSSDGINWERYSTEPVLEWGPPGSWDEKVVYAGTVLFEDGIFKMWYTGMKNSTYQIGYATSNDGISWTKYVNNPIMGMYDANPFVIRTGWGYEMWYNHPGGLGMFICYAGSIDGITWEYLGTVLAPGDWGSFDDQGPTGPRVLFDDSTGLYQMWYTAWHGNSYYVGYATDSTLVKINDEYLTNEGLSIFPNPITGESKVTFIISEPTVVSLEIFSIDGKKIQTLLENKYSPGLYSIPIDSEQLAHGLYICRLETAGKTSAIKFLVNQHN